MNTSTMWAKLLSHALRFAVPLREGIWLLSAAWFGIFTRAEEVVWWRSCSRLESIWLQLPPQTGALEEAERKSTKRSVFGSGEFSGSCLRRKGKPMQRSSDFGHRCCCSTPACRKFGLSTGAGQGVPASVVAATAPGELQGEAGSDSR